MRRAFLLTVALAVVAACRDRDAPKPGSAETARWIDQVIMRDDGERVRIIGTIAEPITIADNSKVVLFWLAHGGAKLRVVYRGTLPDQFRVGWAGAAVGHWRTGDDARSALADHGLGSADAGGVFVAQEVLAYVPRF
jgi:hypothetical protein